MKIETNTQNIGGTVYIRIPPALVQHLELDKEKTTIVIVQDEEGKHGKYFSAWKKQSE